VENIYRLYVDASPVVTTGIYLHLEFAWSQTIWFCTV